ncbi:MAG: hypothetical protein JSV17_17350 [Candidatus Aminicenantes bacterium]|nr:MAG: hypothetical protein JSV17_17350 [Candidatus Aminicenantes bacterium]
MIKIGFFRVMVATWLVWALFFLPTISAAEERFQIELYGGISFVNPKDFNLLSKAEQQYNDIYFIERLRSYNGYFVNDFPEIREAIPGGIRFRYHVSEKLSFSLAAEGFFQKKEQTFEGSFYYSSTASENHTKRYDPYKLRLSGFAVLGGIHYRLPVGSKTDIEVGAAAGWAKAQFDFSSNWTYRAIYQGTSVSYDSVDGGILEEDGSGNGFMGQAMLRLNRMLGRRIGFFVETAFSYCRMKSVEGGGREIRINIPGETTWEGAWGIKKEEIHLLWGDKEVLVPTNYWAGWIDSQRERDFVLDLSGFRLVLGIVFRL